MTSIHKEILDLVSRGDWHGAHELVQHYSDGLSCQIHAYLHRLEGDDWNAEYWYRRAQIDRPENSLEEELARIYGMLEA